jgi:hypothetical protein
MTIEIHLAGRALSELVGPSEALLRIVAQAEPTRREPDCRQDPKRGDPVAVAALILAVPGAVLAAMDIIERTKLAAKVKTLLKKARQTEGSATLKFGEHPFLDLKNATDDQVMDLIFKDRD